MTTQNLTYRIIGILGPTEVVREDGQDLITIGTRFLELKQAQRRVSFRLWEIDGTQKPTRKLLPGYVKSVVGKARNELIKAEARQRELSRA